MTHPHPNRRFVPQAVLTRSGKHKTVILVNTADSKAVNTIRPVNIADSKVVNTVRPVNTTVSKSTLNCPRLMSNTFKSEIHKSQGISTRNKCYLTEYEEYDGGFVSFGDGKGRIYGNGKIKTRSLDFDDLLDKSQVFLRVPRKDNIYSVDLKSVVPTGGLTCFFAKATIDESNIWHKRLGHINSKTMNKLNGVAERKNRTLIEAARTMLVNSKLPTTFWAEVINTACYVLNRALVRHQTNDIARNKDNIVAGQAKKDIEPGQEYILILLCTTDPLISQDPKDREVDAGKKAIEVDESGASNNGGKDEQATRSEFERLIQKEKQTEHISSTNSINTVSTPISTAGPSFANAAPSSPVNTAGTSNSTTNAFEEHLFK
ncbi:ribonuclease H-like domain-containing protein [Tanacetum coccineum]